MNKLKWLRITIQYSHLEGNPNDWIMDVQAKMEDGKIRSSSWQSPEASGVIAGMVPAVDRLIPELRLQVPA